MGKYNSAIITTEGINMFASAIGGGETVTFMTMQASSHAYPSTTDFMSLTSLQDVEATVNVNYAGVYNTNVVQVSARFDNDGVSTAYLINTLGLFAKLGNGEPKLAAVVTAVTPDQMPVYDANNPSAFIYNLQCTVQNAGSMAISVNPAGTVTVEQFNEEMATKLGRTDNAVSATKLVTSRSLTVDLESNDPANFDGTADAAIGVSGELPIANGGTGASTQSGARSALGVPPTNHAAANTTYGSGTATNYGHVKLSDTYDTVDANADAAHGVGASALALQESSRRLNLNQVETLNAVVDSLGDSIVQFITSHSEQIGKQFNFQDSRISYLDLTPGYIPSYIWFFDPSLIPFGHTTSETDLNKIITPTFSYVTNSTNGPNPSHREGIVATLLISASDTNTAIQLFVTTYGEFYGRARMGGSWTAWRTL